MDVKNFLIVSSILVMSCLLLIFNQIELSKECYALVSEIENSEFQSLLKLKGIGTIKAVKKIIDEHTR